MVGLMAGLGGLVFGVLFILFLLVYLKATGGCTLDEPLSGPTAHDPYGHHAPPSDRPTQ